MKNLYHTAFLAGIDPIVKLSDVKTYLYNNYSGIHKIDSPKDQKKGFLFVHFKEEAKLNNFMKYGRIKILDRDVVVKPFLKGRALKEYQARQGKRRLFVKSIPTSWTD